uniref:Uncharacterized protein n=1 Tax=Loa loa TaxID=7209 RepID=A0A1I7VR85_LOALO
MAADVCAEQLPSTSYATTTAISSSSTTSIMQVSEAVVKVATSTTLLLGSCYMSQSASSTSFNYHQVCTGRTPCANKQTYSAENSDKECF